MGGNVHSNSPMAIVLHVVSYFPPERLGGVGEVVATLHRHLLASGHQSTVLTSGTDQRDPTVRRIARTPLRFAVASLRMAWLARGAEVVHIHHGEGLGLVLAMRLLRISTPVLLTLHVDVRSMRPSMRPYRVAGFTIGGASLRDVWYANVVMPARALLDRVAIRMADRISFISRSAARDSLGSGTAEHATVVYNSVEPTVMPLAPAAPRTDLLFVGTNSRRKRVETLPLVLAYVRERVPEATLRIVGLDREDNPDLNRIAKALGVEHAIVFEGRRSVAELGAYYAASRVLIVPSAYEGLPLVILEAFQAGLPVVATRVSGHPEAIDHGVNGLLVPVDDPRQMAEAACRILESPDLAVAMGDAALRTVGERFSIARQLEGYLAIYASLRPPA